MIIAEDNRLNLIDQSLQYVLQTEQKKLRKQGFKVEFPPFFRERDETEDGLNAEQAKLPEDQSSYCMQMGIKLNTGRSICKKVALPNAGQNQQFFMRQTVIPE